MSLAMWWCLHERNQLKLLGQMRNIVSSKVIWGLLAGGWLCCTFCKIHQTFLCLPCTSCVLMCFSRQWIAWGDGGFSWERQIFRQRMSRNVMVVAGPSTLFDASSTPNVWWTPIIMSKLTILSTILYYTMLYYTILCYTILCYTILYCTILYYTILYYTILYCTVLYLFLSCNSEMLLLC